MLALYHLFIYVLPLEIQLSRGESWDPIHNSITFLCLSQARIKFVSDFEHKIMTYDIGNLNPGLVRVMVFIATFNNISVISLQSVSLVEESGVPGENHRPASSH
jgi:hypothetical protein